MAVFVSYIYIAAYVDVWNRYGAVGRTDIETALGLGLSGPTYGGVAARLSDGSYTILGSSEIKTFGEAVCDRDIACVSWRRGACRAAMATHRCAVPVSLAQGGFATAHLRLLGYDRPASEIWHAGDTARFVLAPRAIYETMEDLCDLGAGCYDPARMLAAPSPPSGAPTARRECRDGFCGPAMVPLPPGRYWRGSSEEEIAALHADQGVSPSNRIWQATNPARRNVPSLPRYNQFEREGPRHEVVIARSFVISETEITVDEWNGCVSEGGCRGPLHERRDRHDHPVSGVRFAAVVDEYIPWLNRKLGLAGETAYRLPSDAEWEYAARAGTTTRYPTGDRVTSFDAPIGLSGAVPVRSYPPNAFGVYGMMGGVSELVADCYDSAGYRNYPRDGAPHLPARCSLRTVRKPNPAYLPINMRPAARASASPEHPSTGVGFRLARTLPSP